MIGRLFHKRPTAPERLQPGLEFRVDDTAPMALPGAEKEAQVVSRIRIAAAGMFFLAAFGMIGARAVTLSLGGGTEDAARPRLATVGEVKMSRADIVDRNGVVLATNLPTVDLIADPRKVMFPEDAALKLSRAFPDLVYSELLQRLTSGRAFAYIKRDLTPNQQEEALKLGIPGVDFQNGETRVYPQGHAVSHVLGMTDIDGKGIAGIEKAYDSQLTRAEGPLTLSLDLRVQHLVREELQASIDKFKAKGGAGLVLDVKSGELLAMASLPDFDPQHPPAGDDPSLFNRATKGTYEMGSTFKLFNAAVALDAGTATEDTRYDATRPLQVANFTIRDFHPEKRPLTVSEILIHSSNIGAALMAAEYGTDTQRVYFDKFGLLQSSAIEVPEIAWPQTPVPWRPINTMTIGYGHGISVTPLHVINAVEPLVNGGLFRPATLIKRDENNPIADERIIKTSTSDSMRHLMRLVVTEGSGKKAQVPGYMVGGKTGSAEKIGANGRYNPDTIISSFVAAFPMSDPRYVVLAMLDEPQGIKETYNFATAGWNAAPTVGNIITRLAPMMGLQPIYHDVEDKPKPRGGLIDAALRSGTGGGVGVAQ